jgi:hypothetical protein
VHDTKYSMFLLFVWCCLCGVAAVVVVVVTVVVVVAAADDKTLYVASYTVLSCMVPI